MSTILIQYLFFVVWFVQLDCEVYLDRPKIVSANGNLIIRPAFEKNIYLIPNGQQSGIYVGDINLLEANFSNRPDQINDHRTNNDYQSTIKIPNDIIQRLENLENLTASLQNNFSYVTVLSRRVNTLTRTVSTLRALLNGRGRDQCESQPCEHGGTCLNLVNGHHCLCPPNWEGKNCEIDVNECRNFAGTDLGCQNGATCINRPGTYECLCRPNWFGLHCTRKAKDCQEGDFEMCGHGICIKTETGEGIKCICNQGWTTNGTGVACLTDVNECDSSQGPRCSVNPRVDCINLPGSFRCGRCPSGYDGDGFVCADIDECTTIPNGGCSTTPMVTCHNTIGSRVCGSCPPGYDGDGVTCTWRGSCFVNHGGCHPSARCIDSLSYGLLSIAQCICPEGMIGNGIGIHGCYISTDNNVTQGCEGNPCGPNGQCHPLHTGYTCICFKGYRGAHCDNNDVCLSNPCLNGGSCRPDSRSDTGFRCECTALFSGPLCQMTSKPCGGVLDEEEGSIAYPISNTTYNHNSRCAWVIRTAPDKVINVTFSKFNLENHTDCLYDFLQIHDGRSSASQLIGRFCGSTYPNGGNILSSHNYLYFWFRSDRTVAKEGFALHWTSVKPFCGGEIDATIHGHISSPGSPSKYPPNRDCYWHLTTNLGKRIQLHFFALDIEAHPNCNFDYLAIYDGQHTTDPLLDKFCNSTQPAPIQSAGSEILIHFHSDAYGAGNGFQIAFAPVDGVPGCGGFYTTDKGEIMSPAFNDKYLNNLLCDYKIRTSPEEKIRIDFKSFQLERSFRCRYDYLKIYDGPNSESRLVGKYCGKKYPKSYTSSSNTLFLQFKTDHSMTSDGFRLTYESVCHLTIVGDSGILKSPGYPFSYPSNKICEYVIRTKPGKAIVLTFQDFDIEDNNHFNCMYDNVEIRDGPDRNATLLGKFCGGSDRMPPVQTSSLNYMYIRFTTDISISGTGFYANYTTIDINCGGIYREMSGVINHPSLRDTYSNDESCTWMLIAPEGMHIMLTWNRFDIEDMPHCYSDYLELIDFDNENINNTLGKYCGNSLPPALTVVSNRLMIKFESDQSIIGSGFSVSYTFLDEKSHCGGLYVKTEGQIYSPGWPQSYESNKDCKWTITVPVGQQILLNITDFNLEQPLRNKCDVGDYLEIRNGPTSDAPLIGTYCGTIRQKQIISTANSVYLHFHSDFYITGGGFKITWDGTLNGCGGTLTGSTGTISSPNYPNDYNENSECFYKIVTSSGSRLRLTFVDLQLERTPDCTDDYVEIFDGRDLNSISFGRFCHMLSNIKSIETTSNYAYIKFVSDFLLKAKGFLLNYETICNTSLSGDFGVIESPGFPNNYPINSDCIWTITVLKGSRINATFTEFNIHKFTRSYFPTWWRYRTEERYRIINHTLDFGCGSDYLQIREIPDKIVPKLCGSVIPQKIHTIGNFLQIKFASGPYFTSKGFRLEWVRSGCGGHIKKQFGTLKVETNSILPGEMECDWLIESPAGRSITLTITDLVMAESPNCTIDALEIYNGQSISSPLITKICHSGVSVVSSTGNLMYVKFVKKSPRRDIYFISMFDTPSAVCGGRIEARSGWVYSKNYPKNYDSKLDCIWYVTVPINHRIELNFVSVDLYGNDQETNCDDVIKIYDGDSIFNKTYDYRICPKTNLTQIVSKKNNLVLQFITNSYGTARGFKANFTMTCGSVIDALYDGIITNDKYISHSAKNCSWTILAPQLSQKIKLTITHMSIPQNGISNIRCPHSFLKIFDGNDDSAPLIGEYCGRAIPPMIVSKGSAMTIQFGTHSDTIDGQFSAYYSSLATACGGSLTSEEGNIASPNYPLSYPVNADCEWILSTSPGNRVFITFENFDLEYSEGCNEDYLEVRENDGGGELLGVYCGNIVPSNTTAATKLYIKFHSNNKNAGQGFVARYGFLHGNEITNLEAGEIASPLYPHPYGGSGDYTWRIITDGSGNIYISIDHLEIHQREDFCISYLVIYDGYDDDAPVLDKLCGTFTTMTQPKNIQSTSNVVYIKLVIDVTNTGSLFHLQWSKSNRNTQIEESNDKVNCGSNVTELILPNRTSTFQSPNYPEDYENDLNCEWIFKSLPGRHLRIYFSEISLEETNACYADYISIYSSINLINWSPIKDNFCVFEDVPRYLDSLSYMKVNFKTDSSVSRKGFQARVKSICGGVITEQSGTVTVTWLDLKNIHDVPLMCNWTVKARPGRTIKLKFDHFNITNTQNECTTYVILKNGESDEAPVLGKYCGYDHENRDNIISSSNAIHVTYVRRINFILATFQNFRLHYEEQNIECGGTTTLDSFHNSEIISSPNYPYVPVPYTECVWVFVAPPGEILKIDFIDRFDLQRDDSCSQEFVEIRDGSSEHSPLIKRVCNERPETVKTNNNYLYIKYGTHVPEPRDGFKANISVYLCGGTIIGNSGEITSPSYPNLNLNYGTVCTWHVISSTRHMIRFQLKDLNLPESESPCATKIVIMEKIPANDTLRILKTICDTDDIEDISDSIETFTNEAIIQLHINKPTKYLQISGHRGFKITFNSSRPSCGGIITTPEGFLTTPGYPSKSTLRYCQWIIKVPDKKRRIRLELIDIDLNSQNVGFYDDDNFQTLIQHLSSKETSRTQFIESTGNKMSLYLFVRPNGLLHRFKAKFSSNEEALCGGELSGLTGQLQSPNLDRSYTCKWEYNNADSTNTLNDSNQYKTINFNVNVTSTSTSSLCRYSFSVLNIKANSDQDEELFSRKMCGNNTNVSYRLPLTSIFINAVQKYNYILNFELKWNLQPCGGIVHIGQDTNNIFNVPVNYTNTLDCGWILVIPLGNRLEIKLEGSFMLNCADEYLQISPGGFDQIDHIVGDYCRDRMPDNSFSSSFMYTHVQYHSNPKNFTNLKVIARTVSDQCGGILTMSERGFHSPNYPKGYPDNIECTWEIQADLGNRISLHFVDRFAIEDTPNCTKDVLIIYDWKDDAYTEMARICGRRIINALNSTTNKMKVTLRTDASTHLDGFTAYWDPLCGGKFIATDREQFIYSPGYPYEYSPSLNCVYEISGSGNKISLIFQDFEFEGTYPECLFDNVTIISGENSEYMYETYCGKEMPKPIHSLYDLKINLKTDPYTQKKGFKFTYSEYTCGGTVKNPTFITSNTLNAYDSNMNCSWIIEAPDNKIVVFKFLYISLEYGMECYNDYIGVFDGKEIDLNKRLALFCGTFNLTKTIRSNHNTALLQFVSDSSVNFEGFKVEIFFTYSESVGCGGRINLTSESRYILKSPLIGGNVVYENYLDCHWDVMAPTDYVIKVEFKSFHISPCENVNQTALGFSKCDCDVVELRDGINLDSMLIGRYCGHSMPPQLISSRNILNIRLSTDGEINSSGFQVLLTVQKSVCMPSTVTVTHSVQRWTSPGYESGSIPRGLHCTYDLDTSQEPYSMVQVTIHNLDIEPKTSDKCYKDKLVIIGHSKPHNTSLGQNFILSEFKDDFFSHPNFYEDTLNFPTQFELCGLVKSVDFYVQGRISINLLTSPENVLQNHRGVELEVIYLGFCGRNYTGTHGRIQSSYETNMENSQERDCYTLITAPINHTISAYFINVVPQYYENDIFLKVFDGNKTDSELLLTIQQNDVDTPLFSTGRYLLFHNHANSYNMITYDVYYVTTDRGRGCGGTINNAFGKVTSPLYPQIYRKESTCDWDIETPVGTRVLLRFTVFDLGIACDKNYVELQDRNGNSLGQYCEELPADYTSTDNFVRISFVTTRNNGGTGWSAYFIGIV